MYLSFFFFFWPARPDWWITDLPSWLICMISVAAAAGSLSTIPLSLLHPSPSTILFLLVLHTSCQRTARPRWSHQQQPLWLLLAGYITYEYAEASGEWLTISLICYCCLLCHDNWLAEIVTFICSTSVCSQPPFFSFFPQSSHPLSYTSSTPLA